MRNLCIKVVLIGTIVAGFALPALARGGGGPY